MRNFVLGIIFGGIAAYFFFGNDGSERSRERELVVETQSAANESLTRTKPSEGKRKPTVKAELEKTELKETPVMENAEYDNREANTSERSEVVKKTLQLRLNDQTLQILEENWNQLSQHASAKRVEEGWRIVLKKEDTLFGGIGLKTGDLIKEESLRQFGLNPGQQENMSRIVSILRHIEN